MCCDSSSVCCFFFFKQKTAYEMRISDWSSTCALPISCRRTQYLQRRNAIALDGEIGGDAVADADPGNGQRGQPDQRQELAHAFEKAAGSRRGAVTILDFEPRRRKIGRAHV